MLYIGPLKGVNLPSSSYNAWLLSEPALSSAEEFINSILLDNPAEYIIAHIKNDKSTFYHEYSHALYHLDENYKSLANQYWTSLSSTAKKSIQADLKMRNYQPSNYIDEFQAYLVESPFDFGKRFYDELVDMHKVLRRMVIADVTKKSHLSV